MATISKPALARKCLLSTSRGSTCRGLLYQPLRPQFFSRLSSQKRFQSIVTESKPHGASISSTIPSPTLNPANVKNGEDVPPPRSRTRRILSATALVLIFGTLGLSMAAAPATETLNGVFSPPTDAETLTLFRPSSTKSREVNDHITNCALADVMRQKPEFVESRPHLKIPEAMRNHNLTGGTLLGDDMLAVPPLNFTDANEKTPRLVQIFYLGPNLSGHPGLIHGGMLATLLDEGLARASFPALPNKVGVTASLTINYRKPCPTDAYVALRAETTKVDGRKVWVKGQIELLTEDGSPGEPLVEAEALFIEPRGAKSMARIYSPN